MAYSTFSHARISGISVVVPQREIRLEDELEFFGGSLKKVERTKKIIGLASRRVADEGVTAADLCQQAAEILMDGSKIERNSVDALIFISQGPDHAIPATACILQHKLHLSRDCAAFDVNQGCTAYTYGLWMASSLVESRACHRVLLLVGEAGAIRSDPANRVVTPIFGDCGTATLIEYDTGICASYFCLGTDGSGAEALTVPGGHARLPYPTNGNAYADFIAPVKDSNDNPWYMDRTFMDGGAIFNFTMTVVPEHIKAFLRRAGFAQEQIDWVVLHQANKQIVNAVAMKSGFPSHKVPTETVAKYGNQAGASLPSVICDQLCDIVSNDIVTLLLSGYGVGLSWASAIIRLDHIWCSGIREFQTPSDLPTAQELKAHWRNKMRHNGEIEDETQ